MIFEDEIHNFKLLQHMLEELRPDCELMGPVYTVEQGREYLARYTDIDVIIADVQLNDGLSFDALKYAPSNVPIIFTTAYDEHALEAFEYNSLSYLLKPISEEDLDIALKKAERLKLPAEDSSSVAQKEPHNDDAYRERFVVKTSRGERIIPLYNIRYIVSENKTTYLKLLDKTSFPLDISLDNLSQQLNPQQFAKINRKYIVPIDQIEGTEHIENGKELLILKGDSYPRIVISRDKKKEIKEWMRGGV